MNEVITWDYDKSVEWMRPRVKSWIAISEEILPELRKAREELSSHYHRDGTDVPSWAQYCEDIGISKRHANRLLSDDRQKDEDENVHFSSESSEWNTPETIINKTIQLFGSIDLDPCSNSYTNPNVPAERHYTIDDNGLNQSWHGRVYMNPPYGNEIGNWTGKLRTEYEEAHTTQGIALVPSRTDTEWFRNLDAFPRCFIWGRLKFSEYENSAPFPSMVVYLGKNVGKFVEIFCDMGSMYACIT